MQRFKKKNVHPRVTIGKNINVQKFGISQVNYGVNLQ